MSISRPIRLLALIAALALLQGCRNLEKKAPAIAHADLRVDRLAVGGVVSDVPSLGDSAESQHWSRLVGERLGQSKFGGLPIVSSSEVRALLGPEAYDVMIDRYGTDSQCDGVTLDHLHKALEGRARFVVFVRILEDDISKSETESEEPILKTKTKRMTTSRTSWVRLHVYDLADQKLAWNHRTFGYSSVSESHDMTDVFKHDPKEGVLSGIAKSIANSELKPEPGYPTAPSLDETLGKAIDNVANLLKPRNKN
jgi:hypothetical protein